VRRTADEPLFNSLMESHHYLGYEQPVGEHLILLPKWNYTMPGSMKDRHSLTHWPSSRSHFRPDRVREAFQNGP
jgi:hypothetical protein